MEGLLKILELGTATMVVGKETVDFPVPEVIIVLIVMFAVAGELALYFAKGPPAED